MLLAILLTEIVAIIFLAGLLVVAIGVTTRHGAPTAAYRLNAIRDQLISSVVFDGVDRDNPWLIAFYENVNHVLLQSNLLGGPNGWSRAAAASHSHLHPTVQTDLQPFPDNFEECPERIRAIAPDLRAALEHLLHHHLGMDIYMRAKEKQRLRIQRENARTLLKMLAR